MKIEFFNKDTGEAVDTTDKWSTPTYFVMDNEVWKDNEHYTESQEATVGFDDFVVRCPVTLGGELFK